MARLVICVATAHVSESQMVEGGRLYFADDPLVVNNPGMFTAELEPFAVGYQERAVEAATANPGEIRHTRKETVNG
jgi:hypothetical protein